MYRNYEGGWIFQPILALAQSVYTVADRADEWQRQQKINESVLSEGAELLRKMFAGLIGGSGEPPNPKDLPCLGLSIRKDVCGPLRR